MSDEQIAAFVGYDLAQIAKSVDLLEAAGLLRRSLNPTHVGRFYNLTTDSEGMWLPSLLSTASTPDGRRSLIRLLRLNAMRRPGQFPDATTEDADHA